MRQSRWSRFLGERWRLAALRCVALDGPPTSSLTSRAPSAPPTATAVEPEWWERWALAWRAWRQEHDVAVRRLAVARAVVAWVSLPVLAALLLVRPELRDGVRAYVASAVLVVVWFVLARTKTVSWRLVSKVFAASAVWAGCTGWISVVVASAAGLATTSDGASVAVASFIEESLKLAPVLVLAIAAPGRVRRFATVDWAVLGFTCGAAFNAVEEAARATLQATSSGGLFGRLFGALGLLGGEPDHQPSWFNPFTALSRLSDDGAALSPGHPVYSALVATAVGLAIALWRSAGGTRGRRPLAVALAVSGFALAVAAHAGWNARLTPLATIDDRPAVVAAMDALWLLTGRGRFLPHIVGALFAVCLLVDVDRRRRAAATTVEADGATVVAGVAAPADRHPVQAGNALAARLTTRLLPTQPAAGRAAGAAAAGVRLLCHSATQWWADLALILGAHARQPDESRPSAWARGRAAASLTRALSEEAMEVTTPGVEPHARRRFARHSAIVGAVTLAGSIVAAIVLATAVQQHIDPSAIGYLANLLDGLGDWWNDLGLGGQLAVGAGIAALIVLSGGSLGVAFGLSGVATYGLSKTHGLADLTRDPAGATRSYLSTATPTDLLIDTGEFALTFAPGNFAGALAGRAIRTVVTEFAEDPARFIATRRRLLRNAARDDAGVIDPAVFRQGGHIRRTTGDTWLIQPGVEDARLKGWLDARPVPPTTQARGAAAEYQVRVYGTDERLVGPGTWSDGRNTLTSAIGDAKYVTSGTSWYNPPSLHDSIVEHATRKLDASLLKYAEVIKDPANPVKNLEIAVNDLSAAQFFEHRMRQLGIPGYVVYIL